MAIPTDPKLDKLLALKTRIETLRREKAEAEGALKEVLRRLQADFGVSTIEDAEDALVAMEKDIKVREAKFEAALAAFEQEFTSTSSAG